MNPEAPLLPPPPSPETPAGMALLTTVLQEAHRQAITIATMHRDLQELVRDVGALGKLLRDGNGQAPLMVRAALLEKMSQETAGQIAAIRQSLENRAGEDTRGKWQLVAVVVTGLLSLLSASIAAYLAAHGHHP